MPDIHREALTGAKTVLACSVRGEGLPEKLIASEVCFPSHAGGLASEGQGSRATVSDMGYREYRRTEVEVE